MDYLNPSNPVETNFHLQSLIGSYDQIDKRIGDVADPQSIYKTEEVRKSVSELSDLAMQAAKRMSRTKQKVKTGHTVCLHLLQMINETDDRQPPPRSVRHIRAPKYTVPEYSISQSEVMASGDCESANDRQFSLAF